MRESAHVRVCVNVDKCARAYTTAFTCIRQSISYTIIHWHYHTIIVPACYRKKQNMFMS